MDGATILLRGDRSREAARQLVSQAPEGWLMKLGAPPRSLDQSARFWAGCTEVAKSTATWGNTKHDKQGWHDLFLSAWHVAEGHPARFLLGLEGERVTLIPHSRWMSETDMSSVLDYQAAWCAMRGIALKE